jgi:hypothetical protein
MSGLDWLSDSRRFRVYELHCNAHSPLHISRQKINKKKITDYVLDLNSSYRYAPSGNTASEKTPCTQHTRALH